MISVNITAGKTTADTNIAITKNFNTNGNTELTDDNSIAIINPGVYEIVGEITTTSTASGNYGVMLYSGSSQIGNSFVNSAGADTETTTVPIYHVIEVNSSLLSNYVTVAIQPVGAPTVVSGEVTIKRVQ